MRPWSDVARGSSAIKAHADVIVRQERAKEKDADFVYFGAFMKDAGDVDPCQLEESSQESFLWVPREKLPEARLNSYAILRDSGMDAWPTQAEAARMIILSSGVSPSTANRLVNNLIHCGRMIESAAGISLKVAVGVAA